MISDRIVAAMRAGMHQAPSDFGDTKLPFMCDSVLQATPGLSELRDQIRPLIEQLPPAYALANAWSAIDRLEDDIAPLSLRESVMSALGFNSRRQAALVSASSRALKDVVELTDRFERVDNEIATAISNYIQDVFTPSPALVNLHKKFIYFAREFAAAYEIAGTSLIRSGGTLRDTTTQEDEECTVIKGQKTIDFSPLRHWIKNKEHELLAANVSMGLSDLVHSIAQSSVDNGELSLTSKNGLIHVNMGSVSPLLESLRETAEEYSADAYCHRRALLVEAFRAALAMEEERVSGFYKTLVTEIQNALHLPFPEDWVNSRFNTPTGDLWTCRP